MLKVMLEEPNSAWTLDDLLNSCGWNDQAHVAGAGLGLEDIVKITIFLTDLGNFAKVNEVMINNFVEPFPARATVEVSGLPLGVNVEIEAIVSTNG